MYCCCLSNSLAYPQENFQYYHCKVVIQNLWQIHKKLGQEREIPVNIKPVIVDVFQIMTGPHFKNFELIADTFSKIRLLTFKPQSPKSS